eukprot:NODE_120_length_1476_cov_420.375093_g118_i0.p1 GENE.NODE_120_length_1476_cov_420.375093_g118_i0~~NODE_120_length_1476_cov_420.375093_g118_i0.p1  ORF type:complete len:381 (-),score=107.82 NODE_120_length_1476_cov_420.375093_g118_i0:199-1341(-)
MSDNTDTPTTALSPAQNTETFDKNFFDRTPDNIAELREQLKTMEPEETTFQPESPIREEVVEEEKSPPKATTSTEKPIAHPTTRKQPKLPRVALLAQKKETTTKPRESRKRVSPPVSHPNRKRKLDDKEEPKPKERKTNKVVHSRFMEAANRATQASREIVAQRKRELEETIRVGRAGVLAKSSKVGPRSTTTYHSTPIALKKAPTMAKKTTTSPAPKPKPETEKKQRGPSPGLTHTITPIKDVTTISVNNNMEVDKEETEVTKTTPEEEATAPTTMEVEETTAPTPSENEKERPEQQVEGNDTQEVTPEEQEEVADPTVTDTEPPKEVEPTSEKNGEQGETQLGTAAVSVATNLPDIQSPVRKLETIEECDLRSPGTVA